MKTPPFNCGEYLEVTAEPDGWRFRCRKCSHDLGPTTDNYKEHTLMRRLPLSESGPLAKDPSQFIDEQMELRQFICPGCSTLLEHEISRADDPLLRDIELRQA